MVKITALLASLFFLFLSCKKEVEPIPPLEVDDNNPSVSFQYAYFNGLITDSLTGNPITGYTICHVPPQPYPICDSLESGFYSLYTYKIIGQVSAPFPDPVELDIKDGAGNVVKTVSFNGNLLLLNDTITVDFQVNL